MLFHVFPWWFSLPFRTAFPVRLGLRCQAVVSERFSFYFSILSPTVLLFRALRSTSCRPPCWRCWVHRRAYRAVTPEFHMLGSRMFWGCLLDFSLLSPMALGWHFWILCKQFPAPQQFGLFSSISGEYSNCTAFRRYLSMRILSFSLRYWPAL